MNLPELIKKKRKELKESQAEFGKRFGISHASISDLENGKRNFISFEMVEFIAPVNTQIINVTSCHCCGQIINL